MTTGLLFLLVFLAGTTAVAAFVPRQHLLGGTTIHHHHSRLRHPHAGSLAVMGKDHFDMKELRQRIAQEINPTLFSTWSSLPPARPEQVYIILVQPPSTEQKGVHTIEYPKGSGSNFILAFESIQDCTTFASLLKAQHFADPTPQKYNLDLLEEYSRVELGVFCQVVPKGTKLIPPKENVKELGRHDPNSLWKKQELDYVFCMSDFEVDEEGVLLEEICSSWE